MRKLKRVLYLDALGVGQHQIARNCSISQSTVHEYLTTMKAAGVRWPLPAVCGRNVRPNLRIIPVPTVRRIHPEPGVGTDPGATNPQRPDLATVWRRRPRLITAF